MARKPRSPVRQRGLDVFLREGSKCEFAFASAKSAQADEIPTESREFPMRSKIRICAPRLGTAPAPRPRVGLEGYSRNAQALRTGTLRRRWDIPVLPGTLLNKQRLQGRLPLQRLHFGVCLRADLRRMRQPTHPSSPHASGRRRPARQSRWTRPFGSACRWSEVDDPSQRSSSTEASHSATDGSVPRGNETVRSTRTSIEPNHASMKARSPER